jgi:hypothetical protein
MRGPIPAIRQHSRLAVQCPQVSAYYLERLVCCIHQEVTRKMATVHWPQWGVCAVCWNVIVRLSSSFSLYSGWVTIISEWSSYVMCNNKPFLNNYNCLAMLDHVGRMDRTRILRRALDLKFKGKRPIGWSRTGWFSQVLEVIKKRGMSRENKRLGTFHLWPMLENKNN